MLNYNTKIL